ncbi:MAG: hypothetical protein ACFNOJ_05815 [Prevotella nigrescens]|jgi:hypothetical protein
MANEAKKRKFISSFTFKLLLALLVLLGFGLFYNLVIAEDDIVSEQEQQEEQQRNAVLDTVDVVGDYLWQNRKLHKNDMTAGEETAADKDDAHKDNGENKSDTYRKEANDNRADAEPTVPLPTPAADPTVNAPAKTASKPATPPAIEKVSSPKVEKIEQ